MYSCIFHVVTLSARQINISTIYGLVWHADNYYGTYRHSIDIAGLKNKILTKMGSGRQQAM